MRACNCSPCGQRPQNDGLQFVAQRPFFADVAAQQRPLEMALNLPVIDAERRHDLVLRAAFDEVYARVESFFDTSQTWGGSALTLLVYRVVRQSHPHLDALQVRTLVTAMQRVYRGRQASGTSRRPVAAEADEPV